MITKNHIIDGFLIRDKSISKEEHKLLFKNQDYWKNNSNYKPFINALNKIVELQKDQDTVFLSCICFPKEIEFKDLNLSPTIKINFSYCSFYAKVNFYGIHFTDKIDFSHTIFYKAVDFRKTIFDLEANFEKSKFNNKTTFHTHFKQKTHFDNCIFQEISFENSIFEKDSYFNKTHFQDKTNFLNAKFQQYANFNKCLFDGITTSFTKCLFYCPMFNSSNFQGEVSFRGIICEDYSSFDNIVFSSKVEFNQSKFKNGVSFENTQFESAYFFNTNFNKVLSFKNATSNKIISFEHMSCGMLDMKNSNFSIVNFLNIKGKDYFTLKKIHLSNKETARIIKSHLESQHNIIESNKFFVFEQEKYYDELTWFNNFGNKFVVGLNKLISNHQTSWLKVLSWIVIFALFIYYLHEGIPQTKEAWFNLPHIAIEFLDPLKMFKGDDKIYKDKEFWGFLTRIFTLYLFYQFIVAFRQNTRRK